MWLQFFIVLSCLISVSVNFSTFLVIGKTSPVTYQVLGHLKTCLVLAFGYVLLRDPFSWRNILGILIAVVGMVLYSYCCTLENQQKQNEAPAKLPEVILLPLFHVMSARLVGACKLFQTSYALIF
jgi:solute carrier family 35 protein E3